MFSRRSGSSRHAAATRGAKRLLAKPVDSALAKAQRANEAMTARYESGRHGSRKRALPAIAVGLGGLAGMYSLVSAGVLAVNFNTMNGTFSLYSNYLDAHYAGGFLAPSTKQNGNQVGVADLGINQAKLAGLCAIAQQDFGVLGTYSLVIRSGLGSGGQTIPDTYSGTGLPSGVTTQTDAGGNVTLNASSTGGIVTANNLFINSNSLQGYGDHISGLNLGQNATDVAGYAGLNNGTPGAPGTGSWPAGQSAPVAGNFGLYATQLNVAGLNGQTFGLNLAGQITLPQLKIEVVAGSKGQADCS